MSLKADLGQRIRHRRIELGLSCDALAREVGVSQGFMYYVEAGKRNLRAENLMLISRALGLSMDYLMTGAEWNDR